MQDHSSTSFDLSDYLRPVRAWWWLVLLITVLATGSTYVYFANKPKQYVASTTLFLEQAEPDAFADRARSARNDAVLLRTTATARIVAKEIGFKGDPRALLGSLSVTPSEETDFLTISVGGTDPQFIARLANEFAIAFSTITEGRARDQAKQERVRTQKQLEAIPETVATRTLRKELSERVQRLRIEEAGQGGMASQLEPALPPGAPTGPNPRRNALFAFFLSGLLGILLAYGLELLDRRLRRIEDIHEHYGRSVLATIPRSPKNRHEVSGLTLNDTFVEPFRSLRTTLQLQATDSAIDEIHPPNTILVTSAVVGEGKSTVARNLALAYVEAGMSVAIIDADLRRPSLATGFGIDAEPGLTEVLSEQETVEAVMRVLHTGGNGAGPQPSRFGLTVLTSGKTSRDPSALLSGWKLLRVVGMLRASHEIVIIDSPPLLAVSDALSLLSVADGTLLVSRLGVTPISAVEKLNGLLERVRDASILGVVANDAQETDDYGYSDT